MKTVFGFAFTCLLFQYDRSIAQVKTAVPQDTVYRSPQLQIIRLSTHVYQHISFLHIAGYDNIPCNGMIVQGEKTAIVLDTPVNDTASFELIRWIEENQHRRIRAVIPTHFHEDCLGGLKIFSRLEISSIATYETIRLAKERGMPVPMIGFKDSLIISAGDEKVAVSFCGEGHTVDNVVAYVPSDRVLFGGCLVKAIGADKGNLADANTKAWSETVQKVKEKFPLAKIVIPGHGDTGNIELLDYTISLFIN